jgi:hypothetical protein
LYGYRHDTLQGNLALLAQKYECCEWITELSSRVRQKDEIYGQIRNFCSNYAVNKCEINKQINSYGGYIVLAAVIAEDPSLGDEDLLMEIQLTKLPKGNAQHKILDAIDALDHLDAFTKETRRRSCFDSDRQVGVSSVQGPVKIPCVRTLIWLAAVATVVFRVPRCSKTTTATSVASRPPRTNSATREFGDRRRHHSLKSSLMAVFDRVCASTVFTITAQ